MRNRRRTALLVRTILSGGLAACLLVAGACSTGSTTATDAEAPEATSSTDPNAFPVTIEHKFGETTIEEEPERVATLGWTDQDNALALGVVPVGATKMTWGGNEAGSTDWFDAEMEEVGGDAPVRYDDSDGVPFAEIAKLKPDLILATNSGITAKDYEKLTEIAPVVAYPEAPWVTAWQDSMRMVGKALGRSSLAEEAIADTEAKIDAAVEEYPEIKGTSLIFGYLTTTDLSVVGMYAPQDPRVSLMHDFGMVDAPVVDEVVKDGEFYGTISAENASTLESDVFLTWAENPGDMERFAGHNLIGQVPAIRSGNFYAEENDHVSLAVTNPTPLSIPYTIEHFIPHVAEAVAGEAAAGEAGEGS